MGSQTHSLFRLPLSQQSDPWSQREEVRESAAQHSTPKAIAVCFNFPNAFTCRWTGIHQMCHGTPGNELGKNCIDFTPL
jgi:hypothetical protein